MPLTLDCYCAGDANISLAVLTKLTLHVEMETVPVGLAVADVTFEYAWNHGTPTGIDAPDIGAAEYDIDLPLVVRDYWDTFEVRFGGAASTFQDQDAGTIYKASWYVVMEYMYTDSSTGEVTKWEVRTMNRQGGSIEGGGMAVTMGSGAAVFQVWVSRPLWGEVARATGTDWEPVPYGDSVSLNKSLAPCLCPSGGVPPYYISIISGRLASGLSLDPSTGCITGEPDGVDPGSYPITYRVVDSTGAYVDKTCNYTPEGCPPNSQGAFGNINN